MQKLLFLLLFFPLVTSAQLDFESYKGKLDFVHLPEIEGLSSIPFTSENTFIKNHSKQLPSFRLSKENFRTPVSMREAMETTESYVKSDLKISLDPREYGVYSNSSYTPDSSTKVRNTVYKDVGRGFLFPDIYSPYGVGGYPYYSSYRIGRGPYRIGHSYY